MTAAHQDPTAPAVEPAPGCPKRMVYGPCGGVRTDGGCEMRPASPCVFDALVRWPVPGVAGAAARAPGAPPPLVLTDLSAPPADAATLRTTARILVPACDAVLVGDHQDRPDFSPSLLAGLLRESGVVPWVTLACRDRNRVMLEQELRSLREDGPVTVLCVTGDGRAFDVRPDIPQVFDLDGTRLAALARSIGLPAAVVESPRSPPRPLRPLRLVEKEHAGATVAVLNHAGSVAVVAEFMAAAIAAGLTIPVLAPVPVFTDRRSAEVWQQHPTTAGGRGGGLSFPPAPPVRRVPLAKWEACRREPRSKNASCLSTNGANPSASSRSLRCTTRELRCTWPFRCTCWTPTVGC